MLFDRYGEILTRLEELGARVGSLNNRDRQVMQNLLEEQEWLSATLVKRAKFLLEEIDRSFEKLFDWMITFSDLIDRASGHGGTPAEVLRMERMMQEADELRERLNRMVTDRDHDEDVPFIVIAGSGEKDPGLAPDREQLQLPSGSVSEARREAAPAVMKAELLADTEPPLLLPTGNRVNTIAQMKAPPAAVKRVKKKERRKNKNRDVQHKYLPPKELLAALEQKMAAANVKSVKSRSQESKKQEPGVRSQNKKT